ncbi:iron transporter [Methylobacterium sp. Leaf456]|uniref:DUF3325 domain-containing protein n=1 Tax=Methylobacterium sp. Leaf456 TaxID=1736382 RepID=UPI0006FE2657|nr:DUF3325 domain-containing protein [Methylobacterium sp. Leaf456]KQT46601.1 iron transporter [Methylobacterium sp. Leaf456]
MTPAILALNLGLSFAALSALCLSLNRHHAESFGAKPSGRRVVLLRVLGWIGIGLCLIVAGEAEGWGFGPVQWIGAMTGAGVGLVLLLSYRPRLVATAGAAALGLAMTVGALLHFA